MSSELKVEDILIQIRGRLQVDQIKLWLPPYYVDGMGPVEEEIENLSKNYSNSLKIGEECCKAAIKELQSYSLEKLKERDRFKDTGIATLKVKISNEITGTRIVNIETKLTVKGSELRNEVGGKLDVSSHRIKLIANGKVLTDNKNLESQGVKNGIQLMAILLHSNPNEVQEVGKQMKELETIKADTSLLANKSNSFYMNLEDQSGNAINVPANERQALFVAMALHEKGKTALKNGDYSLALVMFLDADKEFCNCNSSILNCVDNYALLNLDIAWCYLCLKCASQIPEAEQRLKKCEESFHKSYGPNLERLIALKGNTGNEAALFMRLHLLQAIIMYHQNRRDEALKLLLRAEDELNTLKVDENSILALVELGYSIAESRLGLRATQGNVNAAAEYINTSREKRAESRKKALEDWVLNKERNKLGKCADGKQYVEPKFVSMLESMGYPKETARLALQQSNNNVSMSVQIIQDNPSLLDVAGPSDTQSFTHLINDMIPQLEAAGFNINMAKRALKKHKGDIMKAIEELLEKGGVIDYSNDVSPSTSSQDLESSKQEKEAFDRLSKAITMVDDDHLDLTLEQEEIFLNQYKELLKPK